MTRHLAAVFASLGDEQRLALLDRLGAGDATATTLAAPLPITRQAVTKHLRTLQDAGLVEVRRVGREVRYSVRPEALAEPQHWLADAASAWSRRLVDLKERAEHPGPAM